jgi:hypothetical protein
LLEAELVVLLLAPQLFLQFEHLECQFLDFPVELAHLFLKRKRADRWPAPPGSSPRAAPSVLGLRPPASTASASVAPNSLGNEIMLVEIS